MDGTEMMGHVCSIICIVAFQMASGIAHSLGVVATLGFLLLVSLVVSAALTAFGTYLNSVLPFGELILSLLNTAFPWC
jgi:hypothetical protein